MKRKKFVVSKSGPLGWQLAQCLLHISISSCHFMCFLLLALHCSSQVLHDHTTVLKTEPFGLFHLFDKLEILCRVWSYLKTCPVWWGEAGVSDFCTTLVHYSRWSQTVLSTDTTDFRGTEAFSELLMTITEHDMCGV